MPIRVLLAINRASGTGSGAEKLPEMRSLTWEVFGKGAVTEAVVKDHPEAARVTESFLRGGDAPAIVIVGGGGGTLRAVVEGACARADEDGLPGPERVRIAPLRMGSGNLLAKRLGVPRDPLSGLQGLLLNVRRGRHVPVCIGRYELSREGAEKETRFAVALAGFGQFGRAPADLERWHRRLGGLRRALSRLVGLERLNDGEYALALLLRFVFCALKPSAAEVVEVRNEAGSKRLRLLAGAVMKFPMKALPFEPGTSIEEQKLSMHLVPYRSRWQALTLVARGKRAARSAVVLAVEPARSVELRLVDRDAVEMFLDEDPTLLHRQVTISVAGTLAFVPGEGMPS